MVTKEDYIILAEVLRKMEFNNNYKTTYAEETALSSIFEEKYNHSLESIARNNRYYSFNPTDQILLHTQ